MRQKVGTKLAEVLVNVTQTVQHRNSLPHIMPTLLTKSCIYSLRQRRFLVPLEHFGVQCIPVLASGPARELLAFQEGILETLSSEDIRHLTGNGMCLPAVGVAMLLALAFSEHVHGRA